MFFFLGGGGGGDEGREVSIALKEGYHQPMSEIPFKWRFAGGPMMTQH